MKISIDPRGMIVKILSYPVVEVDCRNLRYSMMRCDGPKFNLSRPSRVYFIDLTIQIMGGHNMV